MTMLAHTYYMSFGRPLIGGEASPSPWRRHCKGSQVRKCGQVKFTERLALTRAAGDSGPHAIQRLIVVAVHPLDRNFCSFSELVRQNRVIKSQV